MIFYIVLIAGLILLQFLKQLRLNKNSVSNIELTLVTISFTMTRLLQQVEQDFMSQKIENQSQGLIFNRCSAGRVLLGQGWSL